MANPSVEYDITAEENRIVAEASSALQRVIREQVDKHDDERRHRLTKIAALSLLTMYLDID